jgi:hypothetical protein
VFAHRHFSRTGLEAMRAAACAGAVCAGAVCASAVVPALAIVLAGPVAFAQTTTAQTPPPALTPKEAARGPQVTYVTKAAEEPVPAVEDCGLGASQVRPKSLVLTCADANDLAKYLRWSSWGPTGAYGRGVDTWNACEPYCAASNTAPRLLSPSPSRSTHPKAGSSSVLRSVSRVLPLRKWKGLLPSAKPPFPTVRTGLVRMSFISCRTALAQKSR